MRHLYGSSRSLRANKAASPSWAHWPLPEHHLTPADACGHQGRRGWRGLSREPEFCLFLVPPGATGAQLWPLSEVATQPSLGVQFYKRRPVVRSTEVVHLGPRTEAQPGAPTVVWLLSMVQKGHASPDLSGPAPASQHHRGGSGFWGWACARWPISTRASLATTVLGPWPGRRGAAVSLPGAPGTQWRTFGDRPRPLPRTFFLKEKADSPAKPPGATLPGGPDTERRGGLASHRACLGTSREGAAPGSARGVAWAGSQPPGLVRCPLGLWPAAWGCPITDNGTSQPPSQDKAVAQGLPTFTPYPGEETGPQEPTEPGHGGQHCARHDPLASPSRPLEGSTSQSP